MDGNGYVVKRPGYETAQVEIAHRSPRENRENALEAQT